MLKVFLLTNHDDFFLHRSFLFFVVQSSLLRHTRGKEADASAQDDVLDRAALPRETAGHGVPNRVRSGSADGHEGKRSVPSGPAEPEASKRRRMTPCNPIR